MHLDHSRGKKKKHEKKERTSFFLFLFTNGIAMFICGANVPTHSSLWFEGLAGLVLGIEKKFLIFFFLMTVFEGFCF